LFSPWEERTPFPLGDVIDLVLEAHQLNCGTYEELSVWLLEAIEGRGLHRLVRSYTRQAVENVLEAHDSIEADVGALKLLVLNPQVGPQDRLLTVWGPLYQTDDGTREIRRFRLGSVRDKDDENGEKWSIAAAYVAASYRRGVPPQRVRVVEIGASDGSSQVIFDDVPEVARARYAVDGRVRAAAVTEEDHVVPCRSCGDCKAAGSCRALMPLDEMLGQRGRGHSSRSVSPGELEKYQRCPGQWLLDACLHLPKENGGGEGAARGYAVHRWLEAAHSRRTECLPEDLPSPELGLGLAAGVLTEAEYEVARPFLAQHVGRCPLATADELVTAESDLYGYDHEAEVVPVTRPDLVYRVGETVVVREFKTAKEPYSSGRDEAYDKHLQIPFLISMLKSGLLAAYGAQAGLVELELLTDADQFVWSWDVSDVAVARVAAGTIRRAVQGWHNDKLWTTQPGPHCSWCPVRQWCPDKDLWQAAPGLAAQINLQSPAGSAEDKPPF
jgi:hypothetical protein